MQQRITIGYDLLKDQTGNEDQSEPLRIDVYTSEYCTFCDDAIKAAKSAACRLSYLMNPVEVRETPVDNNPDLIESLNLIALPMIQVGHARIIGIPTPEDIERLVHESVLMR
ncbi:MAG: hypothetical protein ACFFCT_00555 [Candidatus Odinarchaeota archaeon]|nr:hypothetical protein [Candidatus Thorarchaeota archaeon]